MLENPCGHIYIKCKICYEIRLGKKKKNIHTPVNMQDLGDGSYRLIRGCQY